MGVTCRVWVSDGTPVILLGGFCDFSLLLQANPRIVH
jgi:hypothetical protein